MEKLTKSMFSLVLQANKLGRVRGQGKGGQQNLRWTYLLLCPGMAVLTFRLSQTCGTCLPHRMSQTWKTQVEPVRPDVGNLWRLGRGKTESKVENRGEKPTVLALNSRKYPQQTPKYHQRASAQRGHDSSVSHPWTWLVSSGRTSNLQTILQTMAQQRIALALGPSFFFFPMEFVLVLIEKLPLGWEIIQKTPEFKSPLPHFFLCCVVQAQAQDLTSDGPDLESWICGLPNLQPWPSHLAFVNLTFFICTMRRGNNNFYLTVLW